jgi:uncharacterized protein (UPF0332 family)
VTDDNKRGNIAAEIAEARRLLAAADRNAAESDLETAANRLYFAAMHATRALCMSAGLEPKTHRGLQRLLSTRFVATGTLPSWAEQAYGQLETERDLADYATGYRVTPERYQERRDRCERLLAEIERVLREQGWT